MSGGSGGDAGKRRGGRPRLTEEDRSLWQRISSSVEPLRQAKPRVPEVESQSDSQPAAPRSHGSPSSKASKASTQDAPAKTRGDRPPPAKTAVPAGAPRRPSEGPAPLPSVHRRQARRIASGVIEIEARLDLHGATQSVAHARLIAFLQRSATDGLKTVLVITGKGASRERVSSAFAGREREDIGVLRRSVPRWLAEAPLRGLVISYQTAAPRHGGDGAFYILLRRGRRSGS